MTVAAALLAPAGASATTICVPGFHAGCADDGTKLAQADLETALNTQANDGEADEVRIAPGTYVDPDTFEVNGTDALDIVGSGPAETTLTSSANMNVFVVSIQFLGRQVDMRDLEIEVPSSFPDGAGSGLQGENVHLENVDVVSHNPLANGVFLGDDSSFRDGEIRGAGGGSLGVGIQPVGGATGTLSIERTRIVGSHQAIVVNNPNVDVRAQRIETLGSTATPISVRTGDLIVENALLAGAPGSAIFARSDSAASSSITARHVTMVGTGTLQHAVAAVATSTGDANLTLTNSIAAGYPEDKGLLRAATNGAGNGEANVTVRHSNIDTTPNESGNGTLDVDGANIHADPRFRGGSDYRLCPESPSVDAGDAIDAGLPADDLDGAPRPVDGNGDGGARRDMGAYETQPGAAPCTAPDPDPSPDPDPGPGDGDPGPSGDGSPPPEGGEGSEGGGGPAADLAAPVLDRLRFRRGLSRSAGGRVKVRVSEASRLRLRLRPVGRSRGGPSVLSYSVAAGRNKLAIGKRRLAPGKHRFAAAATDAAGNRSATVRGRVRVGR
jgi:hypothetical protein